MRNSEDKIKESIGAWLVVFSGAFFYGYQFVLRVSPNVMTQELMSAFSIDATYLGFFSSCYYISYCGSMIPLGLLMDRYGPRRLFITGSLFCALSCLLFSFSQHPQMACVARFIMGIGAASGFLGTLKLGTMWLPAKRFGRVIALTLVLGTLGAVVGGTPLRFAMNYFGWRAVTLGLGFIAMLISFIFLLFVKEKKITPQHTVPEEAYPKLWPSMKLVLSSAQVWKVALYGMLMYLPIVIMGDLWGVSFLERFLKHQEGGEIPIGGTEAASIISAMFIGMSIGCPCFATFSDFIKRRRGPILWGTALCLVFYLPILYSRDMSTTSMYILFFLVGFFYGGKSLSFASVVEYLPLSITGLALGFTNMLVMVSGMIGLPCVSFLLDLGSDKKAMGIPPEYSLGDFRFALSVIPVCILVALLLGQTIRESYPDGSQSS
ncbi:MAG: MFS transporter [Oligoflexales bacterium]|nr:MFS transporter [Oligoflexales bacterium]